MTHTTPAAATTVDEVIERRPLAAKLLQLAIELERAGKSVEVDDEPEDLPVELERELEADPALWQAFEDLTPGRRRSYILHISGAKKSETRTSRVQRCRPKIFAGKGFNERRSLAKRRPHHQHRPPHQHLEATSARWRRVVSEKGH